MPNTITVPFTISSPGGQISPDIINFASTDAGSTVNFILANGSSGQSLPEPNFEPDSSNPTSVLFPNGLTANTNGYSGVLLSSFIAGMEYNWTITPGSIGPEVPPGPGNAVIRVNTI